MNDPKKDGEQAGAAAPAGAPAAEAGTPAAEAGPPEAAAAAPEALADAGEAPDRAAALEAEVAALKDQLLRALAETENLRRRAERERAEVAKYAMAGFARDLLSTVDNLRRALESAPADADPDADALKNLLDGIGLTERELLQAMAKHGVSKIEPMDVPFDHNFHQAMFEVPGTGKPAGTVVQLMQPGYLLHDRLLRPAMVGLAKAEDTDADHQPVDTTA